LKSGLVVERKETLLQPAMRILPQKIAVLDQGASPASTALIFEVAGTTLALEVHLQHVLDDGAVTVTFVHLFD